MLESQDRVKSMFCWDSMLDTQTGLYKPLGQGKRAYVHILQFRLINKYSVEVKHAIVDT